MKDLNETDPIALLRANVAHPFEQARAMPPEVYTSEAFLAAEIEHIFSREWLCLGRASALAEPGDYAAWEIAGQPVAVVRDRDGPCAPSRTSACTGCRRCCTGRGRVRAIVCPYHAWTYNLDGVPARGAGDVAERGLRPQGLPPAGAPLRGVAGLGLRVAGPGRARRSPNGSARSRDWSPTSGWRPTSRPSSRPTSGTPTGRCWPRTSWRATTCRSATRRRSAGSRSSTRWSARRGARRSTITRS